jgi:hypothetical protein
MYINTETNQYPLSASDIRSENPNTSFPSPFVPPEQYKVVFPTPQPSTYNLVTQIVRETAPQLTSKGHWEQCWEVVPKFQEYTDEDGVLHTVAEQEAAAIAADTVEKLQTLQESIVKQTQDSLDTFAKTRNYDGILSASTYATSTIPKFQQEGQYALEARDQTWATLYEILAEVQAGTRPAPQSYADIEPDLPVLAWPVQPE